jgi:hypothetical protein
MDNGYRAITQDEGAVVELGDQYKQAGFPWVNMTAYDIGESYNDFTFSGRRQYRRPIAQDEPLASVFDACTSNQPELPDSSTISKQETVEVVSSKMENTTRYNIGDVVTIKSDLEPDSRIIDFAGKKVTIDAIYHLNGGSCIAFSHEWLGIGAATLHAIQPEQTEIADDELSIGEVCGRIYDWLYAVGLKGEGDE